MGTNYYLSKAPDCPTCGRNDEPLHIGKSSMGWCFSLHVDADAGINDLEDWRALWNAGGASIKNEYGDAISTDEMLSIITERAGVGENWDNPDRWRRFYSSEQEFHERNHSERGPNGLLRHRLGRHCVKHGDGTWDCIPGDFS